MYPEKIYATEKVGSNGIHCLDYRNDEDVEYIRADLVSNLLEPLVMLRSLANQLNKWADESKSGGWSTHQVKPMQEKAAEIYQLLDKVERIEAST